MIALDRERLGKVLGMLGSEHDGEVVAAARAAEDLRRRAKLTWPQILEPVPNLPPPGDAAAAVEYCLDRRALLSDWEISFLSSLRRQRYPVSAKQHAIVEGVVAKLAERGGAR